MSESMVERRIAAVKVLTDEGFRYFERPDGVFSLAEFAFYGENASPLDVRRLRELAYHASVAGNEKAARAFRKHATKARRDRLP